MLTFTMQGTASQGYSIFLDGFQVIVVCEL